MRSAFEKVSPGSMERLATLLPRLPVSGDTHDADGSPLHVTVSVRTMVDLVQDAGSDPVIYRELDASVTAALAGDNVPLLRLAGQSNSWNHSPADASYFSRGQYLAVACTDYPALSGPAPDFSPFTAAQWITVSGFTQPYDVCADWPAPKREPPPVPRVHLDVPVLIVGGDLDSLTPVSDAAEIAASLGANVRIVVLRNTVHVTSEGDNYLLPGMRCARRVIRSFLSGGSDDACAAAIPAIHTPGAYPRTLAEATPATVVSGPDPGETARRAATVAAEVVGDALIRAVYSEGADGPGLRGGQFMFNAHGHLVFQADQFVSDAPANGAGTYDAKTGSVSAGIDIAGLQIYVEFSAFTPTAKLKIGTTEMSIPAP